MLGTLDPGLQQRLAPVSFFRYDYTIQVVRGKFRSLAVVFDKGDFRE